MPRRYKQLIWVAAVLLLLSLIIGISITLRKPDRLEPEWEIDLGAYDICDMQVSPYEEALLVLYRDDKLHLAAYDCNGQEIWGWLGDSDGYYGEVRFWDGKICIYEHDQLVALSKHGEELWRFTVSEDEQLEDAFGIGTPAALLVALHGTLFGLDTDGKEVWGLPCTERCNSCYGWRHQTVDGLWVGATQFQAIAHRSDGTVAWGPIGETIEGALFFPYSDGSVCRVSDERKRSDSCHCFGLEWHEPDGSQRFYIQYFSVYNEKIAPDGGIYFRESSWNPTTSNRVSKSIWLYPDGSKEEMRPNYPFSVAFCYADDGSKVGFYSKERGAPTTDILDFIGIDYELRHKLIGEPPYQRCHFMLVDKLDQSPKKYLMVTGDLDGSYYCQLLGNLLITLYDEYGSNYKLQAFRVPE